MFGGYKFNPREDIPDLTGKVILVTGGNSGLGAESVLQLSHHNPSQIFLAARNKAGAEAVISKIKSEIPSAKVTFLELDLTSFDSIKRAAEAVNASSKRLDILMNNAGIMATPPGLTKDGFEAQIGTNHFGHALLTKLLLPTLQNTAKEPNSDVRIINLSSWGHMGAPSGGIVFDQLKTPMASYSTWSRYGQSKLANVLFTNELARRYPEIKSISIHPGSVNTDLTRGIKESVPWFAPVIDTFRGLFLTTTAQGTWNQLWAATSKDAESGKYYDPVAKAGYASKFAKDESLGKQLWDYTEKELTSRGY